MKEEILEKIRQLLKSYDKAKIYYSQGKLINMPDYSETIFYAIKELEMKGSDEKYEKEILELKAKIEDLESANHILTQALKYNIKG